MPVMHMSHDCHMTLMYMTTDLSICIIQCSLCWTRNESLNKWILTEVGPTGDVDPGITLERRIDGQTANQLDRRKEGDVKSRLTD